MKKYSKILFVALCMSMLFSGCNDPDDNKDKDAAEQQELAKPQEKEHQANLDVLQPLAYGKVDDLNLEPGTNFAIIGRNNTGDYWTAVKAGVQSAVDDINANLGYKGDDKITVTYSAPQQDNGVNEQVNILDEELARYPAAVGIAAVDSTACEVQFDLASENGIPIVAFDSGTQYQDIMSMVDTDNEEAAYTAANKLSESIDFRGKILLFVHDTKSTSAVERETAFLECLSEKFPEVEVADIYHLDCLKEAQDVILGKEDTLEEETEEEEKDLTQGEVVQMIIEQHPEVKGIFTSSESGAKLVVNALDTLGRNDVKVVSFDGGKDQIKRLEEGKIHGLIVQNPFGIGYATVVACSRAVLEQGNEARVNTGYSWVTKDNLNNEEIKRMLY